VIAAPLPMIDYRTLVGMELPPEATSE
jgi:hypothetical protein